MRRTLSRISNGITKTFLSVIFSFLVANIFVACGPEKNEKALSHIAIERKEPFPTGGSAKMFDSLHAPVQLFTISSKRDTILKGAQGTLIVIPNGAFRDAEGRIPGNVTVRMVEARSFPDMIMNNLHTLSNGRVLQTGGMLFIDALEGNNPLEVADGKSIYVDFKTDYKMESMKLFHGSFDETGKINWTLEGDLDKSLISLPMELMDFRKGGWECWMSDKQIAMLSKPEFANTFIATREFEERTIVFNFAACGTYNDLAQQLIDIYVSNRERPLYYCDSLAAANIITKHAASVDTTKQFEFNNTGWITHFYQSFILFAKERRTQPIDFGKVGVDASTTPEDLVKKGYLRPEADKIVSLFKIRQQIINDRINMKKTETLASYTLRINKLGWANVDKFIDDVVAKESNFGVKVSSVDSLKAVNVTLVIPSYSVSLPAFSNDLNVYRFTKKEGGYTKLPVGTDAVIVALAYSDGKYYFGKKGIVIPKDGEINLSLREMPVSEIKEVVKSGLLE